MKMGRGERIDWHSGNQREREKTNRRDPGEKSRSGKICRRKIPKSRPDEEELIIHQGKQGNLRGRKLQRRGDHGIESTQRKGA